ncbi:hypothetical protein B0H11DRAFT_2235102 [Mycena galericulata]|nr:hypothetical protein B0H11DRAFT_2235102 [Mycena galericulata]
MHYWLARVRAKAEWRPQGHLVDARVVMPLDWPKPVEGSRRADSFAQRAIADARMRREELEAAERREKEEKRQMEERRAQAVGGVQTFGEGVVPEVSPAPTSPRYAQSDVSAHSFELFSISPTQEPESPYQPPSYKVYPQLFVYGQDSVVQQQEQQQQGDLERQYLQHLEQAPTVPRASAVPRAPTTPPVLRRSGAAPRVPAAPALRAPASRATEPQIQDLPRYLQLSAHHLAHGYMAPMIQLLRAAFAEGLRAGAYAAGWATGTVQFHAQGQQQWQMPYSFHLQQYPFQHVVSCPSHPMRICVSLKERFSSGHASFSARIPDPTRISRPRKGHLKSRATEIGSAQRT